MFTVNIPVSSFSDVFIVVTPELKVLAIGICSIPVFKSIRAFAVVVQNNPCGSSDRHGMLHGGFIEHGEGLQPQRVGASSCAGICSVIMVAEANKLRVTNFFDIMTQSFT